MNPVMWGSTGGWETLFGGTISQIPNVSPCMGATTIQAALTDAEHIPPNPPDCANLTVTLQCMFAAPAALKTLDRIVCPGG